MQKSNICIFCKQDFNEHNQEQALFCISKIVGGKG